MAVCFGFYSHENLHIQTCQIIFKGGDKYNLYIYVHLFQEVRN